MKIDDTTIGIIKHLRDGRKSYKKITEDLNLAENTVRSHVRQLSREGILEIAGLVDAEAIPNHQLVIIGVKLKTTDMFNKGANRFPTICTSSTADQSLRRSRRQPHLLQTRC
jgi:Lrp/AsnC family transcriptional regulator for asnA, asnC and gidA